MEKEMNFKFKKEKTVVNIFKKTIVILLVLLIINSFNIKNCIAVSLDEDIVFSEKITDDFGSINISNYQEDWEIYYQIVSFESDDMEKYQKLEEEYNTNIEEVSSKINGYKEKIDTLYVTYTNKLANYESNKNDETAIQEYQDALEEYNKYVRLYNEQGEIKEELEEEYNEQIDELIPLYNDNDWESIEKNEFEVHFNYINEEYFTVWAKVVKGNSGTIYNRSIYNKNNIEDTNTNNYDMILKIAVGNSYTIDIEENTTDFTNIEWTTNNEEVVTVKDGKVTGISIGEAIITYTNFNTGYEDVYNVVVGESETFFTQDKIPYLVVLFIIVVIIAFRRELKRIFGM